MIEILLTMLPIYLMIMVGYSAVRTGYFDAGYVMGLSQFALKICLPALVFTAIALPRSGGDLNLSFFAGYMLGSLGAMIVGFAAVRIFLRRASSESWILALGMSTSNSGYLGFPIASLFFGPDAAVVFAMTMLVESTVTIPLATIAASISGGNGAKMSKLVGDTLRTIIRNPLILTVAIAMTVRLAGVPVLGSMQDLVRMLAMVASPLALFVIGATVARMSLSGHWRRSVAVSLGKLLVHPLLVAAMLLIIPGVPTALIPIGILFAAVPMVTIYPILAAPFGLSSVSSASLLVATILSCVTVTVLLGILTGG